jgi:hypothetical protein
VESIKCVCVDVEEEDRRCNCRWWMCGAAALYVGECRSSLESTHRPDEVKDGFVLFLLESSSLLHSWIIIF